MRTDRNLALKLRLQGRSYSEIQKALNGISKSTLSIWLKDVVLAEEARLRIRARSREKSLAGLLKHNKNQTKFSITRRDEIRRAARAQVRNLSKSDLLLVGIALYWAEGYKRPIMRNGREMTYHPINLTNSDPKILKAFIEFARNVCNVPVSKIKVELRIFKHLNETQVANYWSRELGISRGNFQKILVVVSKSSMGKRPFHRLPYGVVQIRINDTNLFHRIMGWIEGLKNQF
jgi:DNA-binding transcriptional ArsR family regulator